MDRSATHRRRWQAAVPLLERRDDSLPACHVLMRCTMSRSCSEDPCSCPMRSSRGCPAPHAHPPSLPASDHPQEEHPCALHSFDQIVAQAVDKLVAVFLDYDGAARPRPRCSPRCAALPPCPRLLCGWGLCHAASLHVPPCTPPTPATASTCARLPSCRPRRPRRANCTTNPALPAPLPSRAPQAPSPPL